MAGVSAFDGYVAALWGVALCGVTLRDMALTASCRVGFPAFFTLLHI